MQWLPNYRKENFSADLTAGLTVSVLLIPQAMAYALIAGLPPIMGLYASLLPLLIYPLTGSSRQLSVGPVALDSLLIASGVGLLATSGTEHYLALAIALAVLVGAFQIAFGTLRMGYVVNFLASPVISGFTSAAAIIIALNQLNNLLGISIVQSQQILTILESLALSITDIHLKTTLMGIACFAVIVLLKSWRSNFPGALTVMLISSLLVWYFNLHEHGIDIIGDIPRGLPAPAIPEFNADEMIDLVFVAATIAFVSFMEAIAVAKKFASKYSYTISDNRELISLGTCNVASGFFGGFAVGGSFSRTAVNADAGARTQLASLVAAVVVIFTLVALAKLFTYTPKACLAAIVLSAVLRLIDIKEIARLYQINRKDMTLLICAFFATVFLGVLNGIAFSVVASLLMILSRITRPPVVLFGWDEEAQTYRNFERVSSARQIEGIIIFRIDASLYFNNAAYLKDKIYAAIAAHQTPVKAFLIDASSINEIDTTALRVLEEIAEDLSRSDIKLCFVKVKGRMMDKIRKSKLFEQLGQEHFYFTKHEAVNHLSKLIKSTN